MKKITYCFILSIIFTFNSFAQKTEIEKANHYLNTKGEVCFTFNAQNENQFKALSEILSIGHKPVYKNTLAVEAYANEESFKEFLEFGLDFKVNPKDNEFNQELMNKSTQAWDTTWDAYPTYSEYAAKMNYYATTYPNLCSLETIGTTPSGRSLFVLKISDNIGVNEAEPEFFYSSTMHGDELAGFPLMIRLIDYLLTNYGTDTEVTNLVDSTQIFICPNANPDGSYNGGDPNVITNPTRANANGQDLNRNYPDNVAGLHDNGFIYQPETLAFMNFEADHNFVLSANFHGGTEVVNYPYDNTTVQHADHDYYERISVEYATNCQNDSPGDPTYMTIDYDSGTNPSPGVTQGSLWYQVYGGRQDYMNYWRHAKEVTIELSDTKWLAGSQLPNHWNYNRQALLDFIKQANYGLQGTITDESGNPVEAKVSISGHDLRLSWVTSSPDLGDYYRLLNGGTYTVTYEAPGYVTQNIPVTISNNGTTVQDVTMVAVTSNPTASDTTICDGSTASLSATGTGNINWYANIDDDTALFSGTNYTTPALNSTTSYFVEDVVAKPNVGETGNTSNGSYFAGGTTDRYLIFSTTEAVVIESVEINAGTTGEMEVQLQDSSGNVLDSRIILVESTGVQEIELNFPVPVGTNLRLASAEMSSGFQLWRNNTGAGTNYPYTNGSITITNSNVDTNYYYFFYDWKIKPYKSARKEVVVTVEPLPDADFTYVVNPANNGEVTFTNTSSNAETYSWDFGDLSGTSNDTNPVYTYAVSGTYDVVLTSTDPLCGSDQRTIQITVTVDTLALNDVLLNNTSIYPNPFGNELNIELPNGLLAEKLEVSLFDILGRSVQKSIEGEGQLIVIDNLANLASGTYLLRIKDVETGSSIIRKLIKQ